MELLDLWFSFLDGWTQPINRILIEWPELLFIYFLLERINRECIHTELLMYIIRSAKSKLMQNEHDV